MQSFSDFIYQIVTLFLFGIPFSFGLYFLSEKDQNKMLWCFLAAWVFMGAAIAIYLSNKILIEPSFSGLLKPSNEPSPVLDFPLPKDGLLVNLGTDLAFSTHSSFVVLNFGGENALTVRRSNEGIALDARVYSADGRIVAEIQGNEFTINPNNYFKKKRSDKSTLIVYNQTGEEAISVRFCNLAYMIVTGTFHKPGHGTLTVSSTGNHLPSGGLSKNNFAGQLPEGKAAFSF